jgi:hypothetical protein
VTSAVLLATGPAEESTRFLFRLDQVPVGVIELRWNRSAGEYSYRSTQLFTRGAEHTALHRTWRSKVGLDGRTPEGQAPVSLWLWHPPPRLGCVPGLEELGVRTGPLCANAGSSGGVSGTLFGDAYRATYRAGSLSVLRIGQATFEAVDGSPSLDSPPDLFGSGLPVSGAPGARLHLRSAAAGPGAANGPEQAGVAGGSARLRETRALAGPSAAAARALSEQVSASFEESRPTAADLSPSPAATAGSCLAQTQRLVERARAQGWRAEPVYGLLAASPEPQLAYPHAWARVWLASGKAVDLDPTSGLPVDPRTHLALGAGEGSRQRVGAILLELYAARDSVSR